MSEWFKEHAWKVCVRLTAYRGFESLSLRQVLFGGQHWSLRDDMLQTPPGPEGSNGSDRFGRRSQAGVGCLLIYP